MPRPDDVLEITVAEMRAAIRKARRAAYRKGEATATSFLKAVAKLNGSAAPLLKGLSDPPPAPTSDDATDPHAALYEALLGAVIDARESGDNDAVAGLVEAYRDHLDDPETLTAALAGAGSDDVVAKAIGRVLLRKSQWDESKHKRDHGKFSSTGGAGGDADEHDQHAAARQDYAANGTRADAFKSWFGDWEGDPENASKVVNSETGEPQETHRIPGVGGREAGGAGAPTVVYHGTPSGGFDAFDAEKISDPEALLYGPGFYFTEDRSVAESYTAPEPAPPKLVSDKPLTPSVLAGIRAHVEAARADALRVKDRRRHFSLDQLANVIEAFESGQWGPAEFLKYTGEAEWEEFQTAATAQGVRVDQQKPTATPVVLEAYLAIRNPFNADKDTVGGKDYWALHDELGSKQAVNDHLKARGYDGLTHTGGGNWANDPTHRVWIAFRPTQIKAVGNRGTFDPDDPSIHKAGKYEGPGFDVTGLATEMALEMGAA